MVLLRPDIQTSARYRRARIRMRPGSMTEKWPAQSSRDATMLLSRDPISPGFGIGMRNSTTPHVSGNADALASSPKSLSKVSRMRSSRVAHASTSGSLIPGVTFLTHTTSCPAAMSAVTAVPGKFSLARKRISGRAGEDLFGTQRVTRICEAGDDVVVSYSGVIRHDVGFLPSVGHQSDHEFDRKPGPADDGLAGQHGRVERNA